MTYLDANARTNKPTGNDNLHVIGRVPTLFGVFVGFVKRSDDFQRNGRLQVWIPEFGSKEDDPQGWITVNYCSPFAGATNVETTSKTNLEEFEGTQTSYGFWMVPPDINNQVLIMFVAGDPARGIWIGSLYNQFMNNMIPAMAADIKTYQHPGKPIPAAEYNKWDTKVTQPDRAMKPYEKTKFQGVGNQGLINDKQRGITNSSARREAPSNVYGILTPGPVIDKTAPPEKIRRKGGSSFIMDDGECTEYIELATKSGSKIRIDESNGNIYVINRDGTAWVQLDQTGHIDVFSQFDISLRAMRDVNIRADRNLNFEAGQNVYISAAKDTKYSGTKPIIYDINNEPKTFDVPWFTKTERGKGEGGNIVLEAQWDMHSTIVQNNYYLTTKAGRQEYNSKKDINLYTDDNFNLKVGKTININSETAYNLKSPTITGQGSVKIKGPLDIENAVKIGSSLGVNSTINCAKLSAAGNVEGAVILGTFPRLMPGPGAVNGGPGTAGPGITVPATPDPTIAEIAELKPLNDAGDILPEIKAPFFTRGMQSWPTIVSRWATYEPCPLHGNFNSAGTLGYAPIKTEGDKTYPGSGGAGSNAKESPPPNTDQGANNRVINPDSTQDTIVAKDLNMRALECQLKIHEGVKNVVYLDTLNLPTAGIGHLLRSNEMMPVGTPVSDEQISRWFQADSATSIKDAQTFVGMETWVKLSDNRKRALCDLAYNMGGPRLNQFKNLRSAIQRGDWGAAGDSLRNSKWYTQVGRRGPAVISQLVNSVDPNQCDKKFPPR